METEVTEEDAEEPRLPRLAYKVSELPGVLGVGRNKVYTLVNSGAIRSIKAGKTRLVPLSAIESFLAGE